MPNQCHMMTCRYNINAQCINKDEHELCTNVVIGVLGNDRYDSFLEWEKSEIERKRKK